MGHVFIPVDSNSEQTVRGRLSKTIFQSPEFFILGYNAGLTNRSAPQVRELVEAVTAAFKNVEEHGAELVFLSREEVAYRESEQLLEGWIPVVVARRLVADAVEAGTLDASDQVLVTEKGVLRKFTQAGQDSGQDADGGAERIGGDRAFTRGEPGFLPRFAPAGQDVNPEVGGWLFSAQTFLDLDLGFVVAAREAIPDPRR